MSLSGASQSSVTSRNIHNAIFSQASKAQNSRDFSNEAPCQQSYCVRAFAPKASTQGTNNLFMSYSTQRYDDILSSVATRIRGPRFSNCAGESLSLSLSVANCTLRSFRKTEEARQNSCAFRFEFCTQRERDRDLILSIKVPGLCLTAQRKASHTKDQKQKCEKIRQWSSSSDIFDIPEQQQQQQHHQGQQNCCSEIPRGRSRCANESLLRATRPTAFDKRATVASSSLRRKRTGQDPGPKTRGMVPSDRPASENGIWSRCRARLGPIRWGDHAVHKFEISERSQKKKKRSRRLKFITPLFSGFIFWFYFLFYY